LPRALFRYRTAVSFSDVKIVCGLRDQSGFPG
jgi:hypothetical protein